MIRPIMQVFILGSLYAIYSFLKFLFIYLFIFIFYTAGSYYLSILYILVYICQSQSPGSSHHHHPASLSPL